jgi:membrane protein DedA with SNARE-associated domain
MLFFVILGHAPWILLITLLGALWLSWIELREEPELGPQLKLWWMLLVLLTHVFGFLALRGWLVFRRRRAAAHRSA